MLKFVHQQLQWVIENLYIEAVLSVFSSSRHLLSSAGCHFGTITYVHSQGVFRNFKVKNFQDTVTHACMLLPFRRNLFSDNVLLITSVNKMIVSDSRIKCYVYYIIIPIVYIAYKRSIS